MLNAEPRDMQSAPRDGTHILAYLYHAPDDEDYRGFGEWREIWWKPYVCMGMHLPWHCGDPADSHDAAGASDHMGEGLPIAWMLLPKKPSLPRRRYLPRRFG